MQFAAGHTIDSHRVHAAQRHKQRCPIRGQRDACWRETDLAFAEWGDRDCLDDAVAPGVDHTYHVRVAVRDVQAAASFVPGDAGGMTPDRNDFPDGARHEVDAHHTAELRDAAGVHAHQLRERIAALFRRAIARTRFATPEVRDVRHRPLGVDDRGHGQDAERNGLQQRAVLRVEHRECIVRRQRHDDHAMSGRVRAQRDRGRAGHVIAERGGGPADGSAVAAVIGGDLGDRFRACEPVRPGGSTQGEIRRQAPDTRDQRPAGHGIDDDTLDSGAPIERGAAQHGVLAPAEMVRRTVDGDPDLFGTRPEPDAKHAVGEHALHAGRRHALGGRDSAGIGDLTERTWWGIRRRLQQDYKRKREL